MEADAITDYWAVVLAQALVKITIVLCGFGCVYLGYKLFALGVLEGGAAFRFDGWSKKIALGKGGPGVLFALFGAVVLVVGIKHPIVSNTTVTKSVITEPVNQAPTEEVSAQSEPMGVPSTGSPSTAPERSAATAAAALTAQPAASPAAVARPRASQDAATVPGNRQDDKRQESGVGGKRMIEQVTASVQISAQEQQRLEEQARANALRKVGPKFQQTTTIQRGIVLAPP